jgi:DNA-binding GntR family transcriptional regulator
MQARLPTPVEQKLIGVNQGSPVLSITRITYSHNDHPVELVRSIYRGDQYELGIILR